MFLSGPFSPLTVITTFPASGFKEIIPVAFPFWSNLTEVFPLVYPSSES